MIEITVARTLESVIWWFSHVDLQRYVSVRATRYTRSERYAAAMPPASPKAIRPTIITVTSTISTRTSRGVSRAEALHQEAGAERAEREHRQREEHERADRIDREDDGRPMSRMKCAFQSRSSASVDMPLKKEIARISNSNGR